MLVEVSEQVIGVICLDATPDGVAAIHLQVNPDKLERITRQWTAAGPHRPRREVGDPHHNRFLSGIAGLSGSGGDCNQIGVSHEAIALSSSEPGTPAPTPCTR
jgi:hypothetical protein